MLWNKIWILDFKLYTLLIQLINIASSFISSNYIFSQDMTWPWYFFLFLVVVVVNLNDWFPVVGSFITNWINTSFHTSLHIIISNHWSYFVSYFLYWALSDQIVIIFIIILIIIMSMLMFGFADRSLYIYIYIYICIYILFISSSLSISLSQYKSWLPFLLLLMDDTLFLLSLWLIWFQNIFVYS